CNKISYLDYRGSVDVVNPSLVLRRFWCGFCKKFHRQKRGRCPSPGIRVVEIGHILRLVVDAGATVDSDEPKRAAHVREAAVRLLFFFVELVAVPVASLDVGD